MMMTELRTEKGFKETIFRLNSVYPGQKETEVAGNTEFLLKNGSFGSPG